jgi:Flp pilus assembly protein protease CpaA
MLQLFGNNWPLLFGILTMTLAAVTQVVGDKVPNSLSGTSLIAALVACCWSPNPSSSFGWALLNAVLTLFVMLFPYAKGLGAGCVKIQTAFAAWIGCWIGMGGGDGPMTLLIAPMAAIIPTLIGATLWREWALARHSSNEMFLIEEAEPNPNALVRIPVFPAQVPLSLGSIAFAMYWIACC